MTDKIPSKAPPPGSAEAIALGCTCPVEDNHHGRGFTLYDTGSRDTVFWYTEGCPVHHVEIKKVEKG